MIFEERDIRAVVRDRHFREKRMNVRLVGVTLSILLGVMLMDLVIPLVGYLVIILGVIYWVVVFTRYQSSLKAAEKEMVALWHTSQIGEPNPDALKKGPFDVG